jgi:hypothetical protein
MITIEQIKSFKKEDMFVNSERLSKEEIKQLIEWLSESDDKLRYPSLLLLQSRSKEHDDVYLYWDEFVSKLKSDNSFQRSIGIMLIVENVRWDKENKFKDIIDYYLTFSNDEKVITARQCIQGLSNVIQNTDYDKEICDKIVKALTSIDILARPNTNWKVMTTDIINVLITIQKEIYYKEIIIYLKDALENNIIDKKLKNEIESIIS